MGGRALTVSGFLGILAATVGIVIAGLLVVYGRETGGWRARTLDAAMRFPGALSHIVIGVVFVATLTGPPFRLQGTLLALLLAFVVVHMPQAAVAAGSARDQIGDQLFEASRMSGATFARTVAKIAFPLMAPGLLAGWALLFVLAIGDLTVSALLSGTRNPVVGFVILNIWENGTYSSLAAMAMVITVVSGIIVGLSAALDRRSSRSGPRRGLLTRGRAAFRSVASTPQGKDKNTT
ncbi:iron ABC transporter permease [Amycolatopsis sp. FDAARGOS 1241]|uniref:ABC transporter permease n=1 Tax=Amycolatopsis sp. FDAARGOS 1241 TaxID=2778070 RepID=UPI00194E6405|nr:ABC transporter permease subunit [Amycolatopsis sp. FDAARGOS 1241]QRP47903.1 ABC transporter permease subunit [Amycolatopsis sp. FDAARGOS 1241]